MSFHVVDPWGRLVVSRETYQAAVDAADDLEGHRVHDRHGVLCWPESARRVGYVLPVDPVADTLPAPACEPEDGCLE